MHGGRHREVLRRLEDPSLADPNGGHRAIVSGDIPAVFPCRDALITDVSSVARDSLHLRHGPLFVAGRYDDRDRLHARPPLSRCADVVDSGSLAAPPEALASRLDPPQSAGLIGWRPCPDALRTDFGLGAGA